MLNRAVPVWRLLLLLPSRSVPVLLEPFLDELHLVPGGEGGHVGEIELHLVRRGQVRSERSDILHDLLERSDVSTRLRLVLRLLHADLLCWAIPVWHHLHDL